MLSSISDRELISRLEQLRRGERETTVEILRHLNEIERRKLHLRLGYSSLFAYCTEHLRYSESATGRRVQAARCLRRFPPVAGLLESGEINLMTLGLVASILTESNAESLLSRIRGRTQREVEAIASTFRPPVKLRDQVQHVTVAASAGAASRPAPMLAAASVAAPCSAASVRPASNSQSGSEKTPTACRTVSKVYVQFLADEAFMEKYRKASALLSNRLARMSFEAVFGELLDEFIKRNDPHARQVRRERRGHGSTPHSRGSNGARAIAAGTRDAVFARDRGRCVYVSGGGKRCGETRNLHVDHVRPVVRGGTNELSNLRLLCARHNQLEADRILGEGLMTGHRERSRAAPRSG